MRAWDWKAIGTVIGRTIAAFVVAAAGGIAFDWFGVPAAWVSGATISVALFTMAGADLRLSNRVRDVVFVFLGISMGAGVTPETIARLPHWPVSLALLFMAVAGVIAGVYLFLHRVAGWDKATAFYAAIPGAMSYVLAMAVESPADLRRVAIAQTFRIMVLVVVLPVVIVGSGLSGPLQVPVWPVAGLRELAILLPVGIIGAIAAEHAGVPAGLLTGAFLASAVVHGAGLAHGNLPQPVLIPCFLTVGIVIGTRFLGTDRDLLLGSLAASVGAFLISAGVAGLGVVAVLMTTDIGFDAAALAFAPGGLEAMTALSFMLGADPAYVATHQVFRFVGMVLVLPSVIGRLAFAGARWKEAALDQRSRVD